MTVSELIHQLQSMPQHMAVRVVPGAIYRMHDPEGDRYTETQLTDTDATEADEVRHMGPWVLIRGK